MSQAAFDKPSAISPRRLTNGWQLCAHIDGGTTSEIWLAQSPDQRISAIAKLLNARYRDLSRVRMRFAREAQILLQTRSPHVVELLGMTTFESVPCLLLSYDPASESLATHLANRPNMPKDQFLALVDQLCLACIALHEHGIAHADLKPANILIGRGRECAFAVKLIDFGSAISFGERAESPGIGGSPAFMSPEHARAEVLDARSDVFSLGALLFRVLSGQLFVAQTDVAGSLLALSELSAQEVTERCAILEPDMREIISTMMHADPSQRFTSMHEVQKAFQEI